MKKSAQGVQGEKDLRKEFFAEFGTVFEEFAKSVQLVAEGQHVLSNKIDTVHFELNEKIENVRTDLIDKIIGVRDSLRDSLNKKIDAVDARFDTIETELHDIKNEMTDIRKTLKGKAEIQRITDLETRVKNIERSLLHARA